MNQRFALEALLPEVRGETPHGTRVRAAADGADRGFQDIENEIRAQRGGRGDGGMGDAEFVAGFAEIADHSRCRADVGEAPAAIEQEDLVKQAQHGGAGPVQRCDDDFLPGQRTQCFRDVFGVLRRQAGDGFVEQENLGAAAEVECQIQAAAFAAGEGFFARRAHSAAGEGLQSEFRENAVHATFVLGERERRAADGDGMAQVFADGELRVERLLLRHVGDEAD